MEDDKQQTVQIEIDLDKVLQFSANYSSSKLSKFLRAIISYALSKGPVGYRQNSTAVVFRKEHKRWDTHLILQTDEFVDLCELMSRYDKEGAQISETDSKRIEAVIRRAESYIHWVLPIVLQSITIPLISSSFAGRAGDAIEYLKAHLINTLDEALLGPFDTDEENTQKSKKAIWKGSFQDRFGGRFEYTYEYGSIVNELVKRIERKIYGEFDRLIESEIKEKRLTSETAEELRQRLNKQRDWVFGTCALITARLYLDNLSAKLEDSLVEQANEVLYPAQEELLDSPFVDEKGEAIILRANLNKLLKSIQREAQKGIKLRVGAPVYAHGGKREPKKPKEDAYWTTDEGKKCFAQKVLEIRKPFKPVMQKNQSMPDVVRLSNKHIQLNDSNSVWDYIIKFLEFTEYEKEDCEKLKYWSALEGVPFELIMDACRDRRPFRELKNKLPRHLKPEAYEYRHACHALGIKPIRSFSTLRERFQGGIKLLP